ncbi:response regulator [Brachybacterium alimentarium]|uniref:response regulator n=1 Tax=Brachybacterium alimentarium TaxID=47845 RepID=UPI003FD14963
MIRLVVADDQSILRSGLVALLRLEPDLEVVGEAADGASTLATVAEHSPDVLLLDVQMPAGTRADGTPGPSDGIALAQELHELQAAQEAQAQAQGAGQEGTTGPEVRASGSESRASGPESRASGPESRAQPRIIVLTTFGRAGYLRRTMEAGAQGFMVKDTPVERLVDAIRRVDQGLRVVDPELAAQSLSVGASPLTTKETEALQGAAAGGSTAKIAATLFLSEGTVRNHISSAIGKLGVANRAEAVRAASDNGWI